MCALTIRREDVSRRHVKPLRAPRQSVLPSCVPQSLDHSLSTGKPDICMLGMSRSAMRMLLILPTSYATAYSGIYALPLRTSLAYTVLFGALA